MRRAWSRRENSVARPGNSNSLSAAINVDDNSNLTRKGVTAIILRSATIFLESPKCTDTLLHWRKEVQNKKVEKCLRSRPFVNRLVNDIRRERGCVGMLFELSKALMNIDHSEIRACGHATSLSLLLPVALKPRPLDDFIEDKHSNDPRILVIDLCPFLLRQLRLQGMRKNVLPQYISENLLQMLLQVWRHLREDTMPPTEVPTLLTSLQELVNEWITIPSSALAKAEMNVSQALNIIQMFTRRALELSPQAVCLEQYHMVRRNLSQLQKRMQVESSQWSKLLVLPLHSPLPGPIIKPKAELATEADQVLSATASSASLFSTLQGWVKIAPGRIRPWSADFKHGPRDWKKNSSPEALQSELSLKTSLKPLARESYSSIPSPTDKEERLTLFTAKKKRQESATKIQRMFRNYVERRKLRKEREKEMEIARLKKEIKMQRLNAMLEDLRHMRSLVMPPEVQIVDANENKEATNSLQEDEGSLYF
eukprot:TRINITY_DN4880_c0_g2_i1.p1 TRINITY_DN4880_c0_g2~~TRINITY_DN4880_c0_g2_i1.p1  ORF type:complete len:482 (-),score=73.28 TRINITY_DN4880_c0_g2_i1:28-1473(-)